MVVVRMRAAGSAGDTCTRRPVLPLSRTVHDSTSGVACSRYTAATAPLPPAYATSHPARMEPPVYAPAPSNVASAEESEKAMPTQSPAAGLAADDVNTMGCAAVPRATSLPFTCSDLPAANFTTTP